MKQGGWTESPFPGSRCLSHEHRLFPLPTDPKGRLANVSQVFFLPPEKTIHLCLGGSGGIMIKSSAGLTEPCYAGSVSSTSSVAVRLSAFRLQVTRNS